MKFFLLSLVLMPTFAKAENVALIKDPGCEMMIQNPSNGYGEFDRGTIKELKKALKAKGYSLNLVSDGFHVKNIGIVMSALARSDKTAFLLSPEFKWKDSSNAEITVHFDASDMSKMIRLSMSKTGLQEKDAAAYDQVMADAQKKYVHSDIITHKEGFSLDTPHTDWLEAAKASERKAIVNAVASLPLCKKSDKFEIVAGSMGSSDASAAAGSSAE